MLTAALAWAAPEASAQDTQTTQTQPQTQTKTQTASQTKPTQSTTGQPATQTSAQTRSAGTQAAQPSNAPAEEPLYREFKGVSIGTSQNEVRKKLGNPEDKSKEMDFFVFSSRERARVYYDPKGNASAVIVTYIGKAADIPTAKAILGTEADARPDGSIYKIVYYPKAGYWVAYSRTSGDQPLTIITMQKMANAQ
jgi:hypothetical protein